MNLVGIDCATEDKNIGVAFAVFDDRKLKVSRAFVCNHKEKAADAISNWLRKQTEPTLLALDAPLGWPQTMSRVLASHRAGGELAVEANLMFRRETDRFIKQKTKKTPLDVGADRIARTAYAALRLLTDIHTGLNLDRIPLAWSPSLTSTISAIEVYPAATLIAHGFTSSGYKKPDQVSVRESLIKQVAGVVNFDSESAARMSASADVLDAVVCLLAAKDFLLGQALPPENKSLAELEGWIWCRSINREVNDMEG